MTSARMLRLFTISSRSPASRVKPMGNTIPFDGAGTSLGEDTVGAGPVSCLACSAPGGGAFLLQPISKRRANKVATNTRVWRDEIEVVDIHSLLYPSLSFLSDCGVLHPSESTSENSGPVADLE